jgi:hypothetical protein
VIPYSWLAISGVSQADAHSPAPAPIAPQAITHDQPKHVTGRRTECHSNAHLLRALGWHQHHHAVDAHHRQGQCQRAKRGGQQCQEAAIGDRLFAKVAQRGIEAVDPIYS